MRIEAENEWAWCGERRLSSTALLCFISLCSCFSMGAFSPSLPEIGRTGALAACQLGIVAGAASWHGHRVFDSRSEGREESHSQAWPSRMEGLPREPI